MKLSLRLNTPVCVQMNTLNILKQNWRRQRSIINNHSEPSTTHNKMNTTALSSNEVHAILQDFSTFKNYVMDYIATHPRLTTNINTYIIQDPLTPQNVKKSTVVRTDNIMDVVKFLLLEKNKGLLRSFYECLVNDLDAYMEDGNGMLNFEEEFNEFLMLDQDHYFQEVGEFIKF